MREATARGIRTLAIVNVRGSSIAREADAFTVPQTDELFAASLIVVPLQRGLDVDKPRNLAKSVTVE